MKRFLVLIWGLWISVLSVAQTTSIGISTLKTTSLIFPHAIMHVDRGTKDVLVQPVQEAENILLVKAAVKDFPETNLSVVTGDGNVYSFLIRYEGNPSTWVFHLPPLSLASISTYAAGILDNPQTAHGMRSTKWEVTMKMLGIYVKSDVVYYQLRIDNQSPIDYGIEFLRFYLKDRKKGKRTAIQENDLTPLYIAGNSSRVNGFSQSVVVIALERFTIPDSKYFAIEMNERNGGRGLLLRIGNKKLMKAIPLPDLK
jgi:hypothetical protein